MSLEVYNRLRVSLQKVASKYHIRHKDLEDAIQEAYTLQLETDASDPDLLTEVGRRYQTNRNSPFQEFPDELVRTKAAPEPEVWTLHDLKASLVTAVERASIALGRDDGTGVVAYLLGSRDPQEVGSLMRHDTTDQSNMARSRRYRLEAAILRAWLLELGVLRGELDVSDLRQWRKRK